MPLMNFIIAVLLSTVIFAFHYPIDTLVGTITGLIFVQFVPKLYLGTGLNNEKHTFIVDVVKSVINVNTILGFKDAGKCGNKSIIKAPDPYED